MQRDHFFTTVTKDMFVISYKMQTILTVFILEPKFEPKKQVLANIAKANHTIRQLMQGKSEYKEAQAKLNQLQTSNF